VVVERDEEKAGECAKRHRASVHVVWGDYSDPVTWTKAWTRDADFLVVDEDERTAASIILGVREQTGALIIAVVDNLSYDRYLRYTGAEHVLSPKHITGRILARHAVFTSHRDTIEATRLSGMPLDEADEGGLNLRLIHIPIMPGSRAAGKKLRDLALYERYGFEVLFISRNGQFVLRPTGDDLIDTSTRVFLLGRTEGLTEMIQREFAPEITRRPLAVIAGFGDVGQAAYREMTGLGIECIVVDRKPHQITEVVGNAEDEVTLSAARIEEANFCIVALNDDNVNIFTTLMARNLNRSIRILARANEPSSVDKLYRAGADYVSLLPTIGGQVIGGVVLSDIVKVILDLPGGQKVIRKPVMHEFSRTAGWVADETGVRVLGIEGQDRSIVRPPREEILREGDSLIVVGDLAQLKKFIRIL
ncbi:MAG: NAD-binding protein, partial [Methanoregulaceae archaeon]|nr:NAD-binding protein [Methanoregulaceae archaeon]